MYISTQFSYHVQKQWPQHTICNEWHQQRLEFMRASEKIVGWHIDVTFLVFTFADCDPPYTRSSLVTIRWGIIMVVLLISLLSQCFQAQWHPWWSMTPRILLSDSTTLRKVKTSQVSKQVSMSTCWKFGCTNQRRYWKKAWMRSKSILHCFCRNS